MRCGRVVATLAGNGRSTLALASATNASEPSKLRPGLVFGCSTLALTSDGVALGVRIERLRLRGRKPTFLDDLSFAMAPATRAQRGITPSRDTASRNAAGVIYLVKTSLLCVLVSACSKVTGPLLPSSAHCSSNVSWSSPREMRCVRFKWRSVGEYPLRTA